MKKLFTFFLLIFLSLLSYSQTANIFWGDDMKIKRGTTDLNIITADKTGVYVQEGGLRFFTIGFRNMTGVKFRKFDKFYNEVYEEDYKSELKGKDLNRIMPFKDKLYIFADNYDKKTKSFITYAAEIDKNSGKLKADWKEIVTIPRENRSDDYEFTVVPSADSASLVLVADISNKDFSSIKVLVMNENLEQKSLTDINLTYSKNTYSLQDVLFTADQKIVVSGKVYEEVVVKKKRTRLLFSKLSIEKYNLDGKKELDLPTVSAGKILISAKLVTNKAGDLFVCGFFSNDAKTKEINGMLVNRIDLKTGNTIVSSEKIIDPSMIGTFDDDNDDDNDAETKENKSSSKKAKDDDDLDGFSSDYLFRRVYVGQDNSILLIAEKYRFNSYTYIERSYSNGTWSSRAVTVYQYTSGDLLTIKVQNDGNIKWVNVIPKNQVESIRRSGPSNSGGLSFSSYYIIQGGMPFYSSFNCLPYKNKLIYFFNDNNKNAQVTKIGDKVKSTYNFNKSSCYTVSLDLENGAVNRKFLFTNDDEPLAMVRHGMQTGNEMYLIAYRPTMLGKSKLKLGKITVK
jgi:hypothetical protein